MRADVWERAASQPPSAASQYTLSMAANTSTGTISAL